MSSQQDASEIFLVCGGDDFPNGIDAMLQYCDSREVVGKHGPSVSDCCGSKRADERTARLGDPLGQ
jgi:hypothetical protein